MNMRPLDILFIEDCQEDIDLAKEVLRDEKIKNRLKIINNGEEAVAYLKTSKSSQAHFPPDVIVLDLNIPKKNGFEVIKEIINDNELKKIPLIIFTTSDLSVEALEKYKLDFRQYVKKTIDFHEFGEAVKTIDQKRQPQQNEFMPKKDINKGELKILLVEDNIEDAELIEQLIWMKEKYQWKTQRVERLEEALKCLSDGYFDVVVLDLFLPDSRGLDTLNKLIAKQSSTPVVVMTGLNDETIGCQAVQKGAQDYLVKGQITSDMFIRSLEYAIERKKLERMKDELLSYVNHELSNPLTIIKESISQIAEGLLGDVNAKQKHFLGTSLSSINRLIMITEDLLLSTKLELGKLSIEKEIFNLSELVREIMATFQASFAQKGLELKSVLPSEAIKLNADRSRIGQVLTNLLNNALKYTSQGDVKIIVEEKGNVVQCVISDTGQGIAEEDIPKLFKKYEQLLSHKRKGQNGTGLGLFICKTLVELHAGRIDVESHLGIGTKFIFTLPKMQGDIDERAEDFNN